MPPDRPARRWSDERLDDLAQDVDRIGRELRQEIREHRHDMREDVSAVEARVMAAVLDLKNVVQDVRTGNDQSIKQLGEQIDLGDAATAKQVAQVLDRLDETRLAIDRNRTELAKTLIVTAGPIALAVISAVISVLLTGR